MKVLENTPDKLVLASKGWANRTISTFDRRENVARVVRRVLFWDRPQELPLADIDDVIVAQRPDAASGAITHVPTIHASSGQVVTLSGGDEQNADEVVEEVRKFLRLPH
jgi:hypothetical protein